MATLTGKITDVTGRAPDSISSITVKAPSVRVGSGTDVIVSSPAEVTFSKTTGNITITGLTGGLSWLYIEGDGWSDSVALSVAEGMISLVEAIANASGIPGFADYARLLNRIDLVVEGVEQDVSDAVADEVAGLDLVEWTAAEQTFSAKGHTHDTRYGQNLALVSLDTDGTPYQDDNGTHRIVLDTDGVPMILPIDTPLVTKGGNGTLELAYQPAPGVDGEKLTNAIRQVSDEIPGEVDGWLTAHAEDIRGEKGEPGERGLQGFRGEKGDKGDKGDPGADSTVPGPYGGTEVTDPQVASYLDKGMDTRAALDGWINERQRTFNVVDYGAVGDGVTDNLAAFNSAYAAAVAAGGGVIQIPAGKFVLSDEWKIWRANNPRRDIVIEGVDQLATFVLAGFYGAGKALIDGRSPDGVRSSPTTIRDIQFGTVDRNGPSPCLVDLDFWSEARMDRVKFGPANSTHLRASSLQNIRSYDVVSYYGGKNYNYRSTDGIYFTVSSATRTITASADIFEPQDTGMTFFIIPTNNERRITYRLGTYIDARNIRIADDGTHTSQILDQAQTNTRGGFDAAHASMTAGSNILTANAACFTPDDVGRVLVIRNARQGAYGSALLRATVTEVVDAFTVELDHEATRTVAATPFAQPVIDFYTPDLPGRAGSATTDIKFTNLQVEAYAGLGLSFIEGLQVHINEQKIHGEHDPVDARTSTGMAWLDDYGGEFSGEFDGQSTSDVRLHMSNMNDTLSIPFLSTRRVRNEVLFQMEDVTESGALVEFGTLVVYRDDPEGPLDYVIDRSHEAGHGRRIVYAGPVTAVGGTTQARLYSGMGTWSDTSGRLHMTAPNGMVYRITVANDGTLTTVLA